MRPVYLVKTPYIKIAYVLTTTWSFLYIEAMFKKRKES